MNEPIIVGIDGSAPSRAVQDLAGWEADMRRRQLRIVAARVAVADIPHARQAATQRPGSHQPPSPGPQQ